MRSSSEIHWVRARNRVGERLVVTDWHAIIPGEGSQRVPPGTVCNTGLAGVLQQAEHAAIKTLDGKQHDECVGIVNAWLEDLDPSPGPIRVADKPVKLAKPGSTSEA